MSYYEHATAPNPAMPALTCLTLDDAVRLVATWSDLTPQRRRDLASALAGARMMCERYDAWRAEERDASGPSPAIAPVPLDCAVLNERLFYRPIRAYGLRKGRFANILSGLRFILRRLGRHAPVEQGVAALGPAWRQLQEAVPSAQRQAALTGFFRFCSREAITPDQVTSEVVTRFEAWLVTSTLSKVRNRRRTILGTWNWAVDNLPGWPRQKLRSSHGRVAYTLPFSAYPASFQADVDRFARRIGGSEADAIFGDDIFVADGSMASLPAHRPVRATTLRSRLFLIRMAVGALVLSGRPAETIASLQNLVQPAENARTIIRFFYDYSGGKRGSNAGNVAEVLRQIALFHCRLAPDEAAQIKRWARNVRQPAQASMTPKNLARLRLLTVPQTQAMLLHLPQHLMRMAAQAAHPTRAATLALRAVAIELLLVCPMRISNLRLLRLDENLHRRDPDHRRVTHLHLAAWETKNAVELDWPLPRATADLLGLYLRRYRPAAAQPGNPYLFPGRAENALAVNAMALAITDPIAREIGAVVNPHLLRHFAAWTYLKRHPGAYDLVRRVLGHKDVKTTIAFYCGLEAEFAAEAFDGTVLDERRRTRAIAKAALRMPTPRAARRSA